MRALALHPDVLLVTSALLQVNCVIVRGGVDVEDPKQTGEILRVEMSRGSAPIPEGESFVVDSPVLPDELDALPALIEQAGFPAPSGLLATHGDWDHLLGRLAFPGAALGVAESTAERLRASPGAAQRLLRRFDEELMLERPRPLALGSVQGLPVPGRCEVGDRELELHATAGHTSDGMALMVGWAGVLVAGDYLSAVELPSLGETGDAHAYIETLERLQPLAAASEHVVPGHGPRLDSTRALSILEEDIRYLGALVDRGAEAELPATRGGRLQQLRHRENVTRFHS